MRLGWSRRTSGARVVARTARDADSSPGERPGVGPQADAARPEPTAPRSSAGPDSAFVTDGMRIAGAWAWRILVVAAAIAVIGLLVIELRLIVIPLLLAVVIAALLVPFSSFLQRHRWPKWLAVVVAELGIVVVIGGLLFLVVTQVYSGYDDLSRQTVESYDEFKSCLLRSS